LAELNGSVYQNKVGAFRVIPYYPQKAITIDSDKILDLSKDAIQELEDLMDNNDTDYVDYSFNSMPRLRDRIEEGDGEEK
jgi:hypothetical protein